MRLPDLLGPFFGDHSLALYLLALSAALLVGAAGWLHARRYWEGLPPLLDGAFSMAAFLVLILAFAAGGRLGAAVGHPHAGRVAVLAVAVVLLRSLRAWLGREQAEQRRKRP